MKVKITVGPEHSGWRLDKFLAAVIPTRSRSAIQVGVGDGRAKVNGVVVTKKNWPLAAGDWVEFQAPAAAAPSGGGEAMPLDIRYEDQWLLVVNKPVGLVVHPAPGHAAGTLVNGLIAYGTSLSDAGGAFRPGIVHRLDKDTSGLLIVAKTNACHWQLTELFKARQIERVYLALVNGRLPHKRGRISGPIGRHPRRRTDMAVVSEGRPAATDFNVLAKYPRHTLLAVRLVTGRTHQIRVHFAHLGFPVTGDRVYGAKQQEQMLRGQALHARTLKFVHPFSGKTISVTAEPPQEFLGLLRQLEAVRER